jgi:phenylpyruvate tautomerase PptA (4-oxalocrotonate tautomerase family)
MSRITKQIAQEVAETMTKELKKNIQSTQLIISEILKKQSQIQ